MTDPQAAEPPPPRKEGSFPWFILGLAAVVGIAVLAALAMPGVLVSSRSSNDRNAFASLKTLITAEADFRSNDRDENGQMEYWTGDVQGLYDLAPKGDAIRLIEPAIAEADAFPAKTLGPRAGRIGRFTPKSGYFFAVVRLDATGKPYHGGDGRNSASYAFCAWPARHPETARWTFIVNEDGVVWKKDNGGGYVARWPADPKAEGWVKAD